MPRDFLQQFFSVRVGRAKKFLAQHDRHFEVDLIGVNTVAWLTDNHLAANAACKVECGQVGIEFLLRESVRPPVEIDQPQRIFEVAESSFQTPTQMIQFPNIRKRKGRGQRSGNPDPNADDTVPEYPQA